HEIALVSGLAAVLSSVSMLASASRRGAIAAVLAVTVQTLESAMKVSDTASTATKRANAASKGNWRYPQSTDICDRITRPVIPVVVRARSVDAKPSTNRSETDSVRP